MKIENFKDYEIYEDYINVDKSDNKLFTKYAYAFMAEIMNAKYLTHCLENDFELIRSQRIVSDAMEYPNITNDNIAIKKFSDHMDEFVKSYYLIAKNYTNLNIFIKIGGKNTYKVLSEHTLPRYLYTVYDTHPNQNIKKIFDFDAIIDTSIRMTAVCDDTLFLNGPTKKENSGSNLLNIAYISNGCAMLGNPFCELVCSKINEVNNSGSTIEIFSQEGKK